MAFQYSEFTTSGMQLLSAASATKTLVIDDIYCLSSAVSESDLIQSTPAWCAQHPDRLYTVLGRVVSVGVDPNSDGMSRIVIDLSAGQSEADVTVRTVIVTAHSVEAGSESEVQTFYGITDPQGIVVPVGGPVPISQQIAFTFAFSRASSITVADSVSNYLLADEVDRFVTTHSTSSTVSGDDQFIYGVKYFRDGIAIATSQGTKGIQLQEGGQYSGSIATDTTRGQGIQFVTRRLYDEDGVPVFTFKDNSGSVLAHISYEDSVYGRFTTYKLAAEILCGASSENLNVGANLVSGLGYTLGTSDEPWTNAYIDELNTFTHKSSWEGTNGAFVMTSTGAPTGYRIRVERPGGGYMDCTLSPTRLLVGGLLTCSSFRTDTATLGSATITEQLSVSGEFISSGLSISSTGDITLRRSIVPDVGDSLDLGADLARFNTLNVNTVSASYMASAASISANTYTVSGTRAVLPLVPSSAGNVNIGDTILASGTLRDLGLSGARVDVNSTITVTQSMNIWLGCWTLSGTGEPSWVKSVRPTAGTYAIKSAIDAGMDQYTTVVLTLQRIA